MPDKPSLPAGERCPSRRPTHPGAVLRGIADAVGGSEAARRETGIPPGEWHDLLTERTPITDATARKLSRAYGTPRTWVKMQAAYDAWTEPAEPADRATQHSERVHGTVNLAEVRTGRWRPPPVLHVVEYRPRSRPQIWALTVTWYREHIPPRDRPSASTWIVPGTLTAEHFE